ncbi:MAG: hypothetical protein QOF73_1274, partial [Thermomicrobiales bacterium]|nr:hypothetical protein [Thermomicrobiales bacterium]
MTLATHIREASKMAYGDVLLGARMVLVGLVAALLHDHSGVPGKVEPGLSERITLMAGFLHGIGATEDLISEGQYIKAAAALKQDLEILARLREVQEGNHRAGRVPNVRAVPGAGRLYGALNDVAHPSNPRLLELLMERRAVTDAAAGVSPLPTFVPRTAVELYEVHVWSLLMMSRELATLVQELYPEERALSNEWVTTWASQAARLEEAGHISTKS